MEIDKNNSNHIFVFGSNTEGRHGKGAALYARQNYGAIYGQAEGLQGNSYAIITKDLSKGRRSIPLYEIGKQLNSLMNFANINQHLTFFITKIGTNNAGYTNNEIKNLMDHIEWPGNCILPNWNK
jgi:hypothetical protein